MLNVAIDCRVKRKKTFSQEEKSPELKLFATLSLFRNKFIFKTLEFHKQFPLHIAQVVDSLLGKLCVDFEDLRLATRLIIESRVDLPNDYYCFR